MSAIISRIVGNGGGAAPAKGFADGFVVEYDTATRINITSGSFEANGKDYTLAADTTHDITGLVSAFTIHYIYIDDSAGSQPVPTFINSAVSPVFDPIRRGFYNGDDRVVSVVISPNGSAIVDYFDNEILSNNIIRSIYDRESFFNSSGQRLVLNGDPAEVWTATDIESSTVLPVNAVNARVLASNQATGAGVFLFCASQEYAAVYTNVFLGMEMNNRGFDDMVENRDIPLGASRNLKWAGRDTNDNVFNLLLGGITYIR